MSPTVELVELESDEGLFVVRGGAVSLPSDLGAGTSQPSVADHLETWHDMVMDATLVIGQQGRLVIPAEVRNALGLAAGDRLHLRLVGRSVVLERPEDAVAELRGLASRVPKNRSLVDELLAERRLAAAAGE